MINWTEESKRSISYLLTVCHPELIESEKIMYLKVFKNGINRNGYFKSSTLVLPWWCKTNI